MIALGGGSVLSERVRAALRRHLTVLLDVDAERRLGARARGDGLEPSARWRATARRSSRCTPSAGGLYEELADAILPASPAAGSSIGLRALPPCARWSRLPRHAPAVGQLGLRRVSGAHRARPAARRRCGPARGVWPLERSPRALLRQRRERRRSLRRAARRRGAARSRSRPARATRRSRAPNACGGAARRRA